VGLKTAKRQELSDVILLFPLTVGMIPYTAIALCWVSIRAALPKDRVWKEESTSWNRSLELWQA
jgi:hypothetical protein